MSFASIGNKSGNGNGNGPVITTPPIAGESAVGSVSGAAESLFGNLQWPGWPGKMLVQAQPGHGWFWQQNSEGRYVDALRLMTES